MGFLTWINGLDRKFPIAWSFLGFLLAIIFGGISIYTGFVKETAPSLEFEILSNEPVLDVREKLPDLEVRYQSQDIASSGKTLSVLIVRVANRGSADLLSAFYDSRDPIEINIDSGTLVRAEISETSNEYLRSAAGMSRNGSSVTLSPVILERDEWFIVKMLVLHQIDQQPAVEAAGKIAGQHRIPVVSPELPDEQTGFLYRTFSGDVWTQATRLAAYFFGGLFTVIVAGLSLTFSSEAISERRRRSLVKRFKERSKITTTEPDEFIFQRFVSRGLGSVQRLVNAVADPDRLQRRVNTYLELGKQNDLSEEEEALARRYEIVDPMFVDEVAPLSSRYSDVKAMLKHGFVEEVEGKWRAVPDRLKVATSFVDYLEMVGGK